ncbi:MAG: YdcH family protein [Elsteraceae bacterium]
MATERQTAMRRLEEMRTEHRDLDDVIRKIMATPPFDQLQIQRLKKRKLLLKDMISKAESEMLPDIIA